MKQQERQEGSRQKIFRAAMEEFGQNNYDKVSMENICTKHHISKGMMYHHYSNKDDLFLLCVEDTFRLLQDYVEQGIKSSESAAYTERIQCFFEMREYFFQQHSMQKCIFENAIVHTPKHLEKEIQKLHQPIEKMNKCFLEIVVERMPLRPEVEK
ncbi:TetR/AcrR family transcriptional regulator [Lachnospiraceae bacterium 45-W7]